MSHTLQGTRQNVVDFEALKERCLGNVDLVERVLKKFMDQLDGDLREMERALATGDATTFGLIAHRIKGSSANIEARHLSADASLAEQQARQNKVAELPLTLERLKADHRDFRESLATATG